MSLTHVIRVLAATAFPWWSAGWAVAQGRVTIEGFLGAAYNFRTGLTIDQKGRSDLDVDADYATRPFESPSYYVLRFGVHYGSGAWELQFTHHKLYLKNTPPEVQRFSISHGSNALLFGRALHLRPWTSA